MEQWHFPAPILPRFKTLKHTNTQCQLDFVAHSFYIQVLRCQNNGFIHRVFSCSLSVCSSSCDCDTLVNFPIRHCSIVWFVYGLTCLRCMLMSLSLTRCLCVCVAMVNFAIEHVQPQSDWYKPFFSKKYTPHTAP